jgi:DNA-binding NarL/FixJ family response regulator
MKIMIVDDANVFRDRLAGLLQEISRDIVILQQSSAEQVLDSIRNFNPDFIILDINLPGLSGIDLLEIIRPIYSSAKIAMLTNFTFERFKNECDGLGADFFYDKTFDIEKLVFEVTSLIKSTINV